jgi:hypothetical protein
MRAPRTLSLILALILAAALPLRGYAATAHCEGSDSTHAAAAHAAGTHGGHCGDAAGSPHPGGCGDCCCTAASSLAMRWELPRISSPAISAAPLAPPPAIAHDRLDRPPRPAA